MRAALLRALALLLVPLAALGPSLLPGKRFLPIAPAAFEPLASERPQAAERARHAADRTSTDALFPLLDEQRALGERLSRGELPRWDARLGAGQPLFSATRAAPLDPLSWPRIFLDDARGHGWSGLAALFLCGLGMWLFLRRRGLDAGPALVGALALQAGGFALSNAHLAPRLDAALWLPFTLWAIDGVLERRRFAGILLAGSTALSWLACAPDISVLVLAAGAVYALARSVATRARSAPTVRALSLLMLGVALAAVQLVPMALTSAQSARGPSSAEEGARQTLPLASTASLVLPDLFGAPTSEVPAARDGLTWWLVGGRDPEVARRASSREWNLFAGAALLALALAALAGAPRRARGPGLLALVAIGFAQGWPLVSALHHLPGLSLGAPSGAVCLAWFAWAWLAAEGSRCLAQGSMRAWRTALSTCVVLAVGAVAGLFAFDGEAWASGLPATLAGKLGLSPAEVARAVELDALAASAKRLSSALAGLAVAASAVALALALGRGRSWGWVPLALVVALEGLLAAGPHLVPRSLVAGERLFPDSSGMAALAEAAGDGRVLRLDGGARGPAEALELARPNLPHAYGIADLTPRVEFPNRLVVELLEAVDPRGRARAGVLHITDPALLDHPVLDLLRVTAVLTRAPCEHPSLVPVFEREGFHVHRRAGALDAVRVVPAVVETPVDDTALGLLAARAIDPRRMTVLAPGQDAGAPPASGEWRAGSVRVERPSPEVWEIEVRGSSGGWLVVSEAWAPGWRAWVDGSEVPMARVDHALRGLPLPRGDSRVRMVYAPSSLRTGLLISVVALVAVLARTRWRARPVAATRTEQAAAPRRV